MQILFGSVLISNTSWISMTPLKMKIKVGHTSSTILNSCSFQRYRLLSVKSSSFFLTHPLFTPMLFTLLLSCSKILQNKPEALFGGFYNSLFGNIFFPELSNNHFKTLKMENKIWQNMWQDVKSLGLIMISTKLVPNKLQS